ncbi:tRNA lysidine(34) synthetase TilS [Pseudonocardia nantongensis]|uniref:tRNA lysidine(34) synthetase TilS n=1 Tax=Pseudonocardia nantongensis TaxID=1181885 RepID=UPI00397E00C4
MTRGSGVATRRVERAVRGALTALPEVARSAPPVVGCSGGADSTALLLAVRAIVSGPVLAAVVDHGLQDGSAARSAELAGRLRASGVDADVHPVTVTGPGGTEAAARRARYAALAAARPHPDSPVLLGHTLDDQAETVLLGLARGSGARSMAGMRPWAAPWLRPLLGVRRADTVAACAEAGVTVWDDPHNADPRFTRVRIRREVLPLLDDVLGGGVPAALARTAGQLRDDDDALSGWAAGLGPDDEPAPEPGTVTDRTGTAGTGTHPTTDCDRPGHAQADGAGDSGDSPVPGTAPAGLPPDPITTPGDPVAVLPLTAALITAPAAVRRRVLRKWLIGHGVRALTDEQLRAADGLLARHSRRGGPTLGGGLELIRTRGRLVLRHRVWGRDRE